MHSITLLCLCVYLVHIWVSFFYQKIGPVFTIFFQNSIAKLYNNILQDSICNTNNKKEKIMENQNYYKLVFVCVYVEIFLFCLVFAQYELVIIFFFAFRRHLLRRREIKLHWNVRSKHTAIEPVRDDDDGWLVEVALKAIYWMKIEWKKIYVYERTSFILCACVCVFVFSMRIRWMRVYVCTNTMNEAKVFFYEFLESFYKKNTKLMPAQMIQVLTIIIIMITIFDCIVFVFDSNIWATKSY